MEVGWKDWRLGIMIIMFLLPFCTSALVFEGYQHINRAFPLAMSFLKFSVLATLGEVIGHRIRTGDYRMKGFGLWPRALAWGLLGITIKVAFVVFGSGMPVFMEQMGFVGVREAMNGSLSPLKLVTAFAISVAMNIFYAPVMMVFHRISDTHIMDHQGRLSAVWKPMQFGKILKEMDWERQWNFVFKKTIPLFWIPAHTITFMLPAGYQVLFAAMLSVALGILLSVAALKPVQA